MKQKNKISIVIAVGFLAVGTAISALKIDVYSPILSGIFAVGLSLLFTTIYKHFKFGEGVEKDERTKRIMCRAMTGSWFATFILIAVMMLADDFGALKMNVQEVLIIVFFGMIIVFGAFRWYFGRMGDAE